jgi:iron only hydrogenase large subunit-like protein
VLITLQSHDEVRSVLSSNPPPSSVAHRIPILSIAPQSLASLAAAHGIGSPHEAFTRVRAAAHALGFAHVIDISFARHLALREHVTEFMERRAKAALSSKEDGGHHLPMLASACPGWVCYAEKTHAEMLPFIAKARSPQAVMGALVKEWAAPHWDKR